MAEGSRGRVAACAGLLALGMALAAGCSREAADPEAEIRALIDAGEAAAEARDLDAIMALVSKEYADAEGRTRRDLSLYVRGLLALHPKLELFVRVESVELQGPEHARAVVRVASGNAARNSAASPRPNGASSSGCAATAARGGSSRRAGRAAAHEVERRRGLRRSRDEETAMRYGLGAFLFAATAFLLWRAHAHRAAVLALAPIDALRRTHERAADDPRSLAALGEISRPLVLGLLAWTGLKTAAAFAMLDAARYFSWFDLAGFLGLLAGYGTLFHVQTRYRLADARAARAAFDGGSALDEGAAPTAAPEAATVDGDACVDAAAPSPAEATRVAA